MLADAHRDDHNVCWLTGSALKICAAARICTSDVFFLVCIVDLGAFLVFDVEK